MPRPKTRTIQYGSRCATSPPPSQHIGLQHRLVSAGQVENGDLVRAGYRVLILPRTIALSDAAATAIRKFVKVGGTVIADGTPCVFDEHGRQLKTPALANIFPHSSDATATRTGFGKGQVINLAAPGPRDSAGRQRLRDIVAGAGIEPMIALARRDGGPVEDMETYIFDNGAVTIVALLRDLDGSSSTISGPDRNRRSDAATLLRGV